MSRTDVLVLATIVAFIVVFGTGLGLSEYYGHVENLAKIERSCAE